LNAVFRLCTAKIAETGSRSARREIFYFAVGTPETGRMEEEKGSKRKMFRRERFLRLLGKNAILLITRSFDISDCGSREKKSR
jgi:hypothetical protein